MEGIEFYEKCRASEALRKLYLKRTALALWRNGVDYCHMLRAADRYHLVSLARKSILALQEFTYTERACRELRARVYRRESKEAAINCEYISRETRSQDDIGTHATSFPSATRQVLWLCARCAYMSRSRGGIDERLDPSLLDVVVAFMPPVPCATPTSLANL